jgi:hypothetical protein
MLLWANVQASYLETRADVEAFRGRYGEHGVREHGLELVKARLSQPCRHPPARYLRQLHTVSPPLSPLYRSR